MKTNSTFKLKRNISIKLWDVKRDIERIHSKLSIIARLECEVINKVELPNQTRIARNLNFVKGKYPYFSEMK